MIVKAILVVALSALISLIFSSFATITGWVSLIAYAVVSSLVICFVIVLLILRKKDYAYIANKLKRRREKA